MDAAGIFQQGVFNKIDGAFAAMVRRIWHQEDPWIAVAAGLVSRAAGNGHVCLDLSSIIEEGIPSADSTAPISLDIGLKQWLLTLSDSSVVGRVGQKKPMILDGNRLYLHRYWNYENQVCQGIVERRISSPTETSGGMDELLDMFSGQSDPDQMCAVQTALEQGFTVISGGPGTGKTTTIAKIILGFHKLTVGHSPKILLAAPTGKAAARLQEAIDRGLDQLLKDGRFSLPDGGLQAQTLHRLLGIVPGKTRLKYHRQHPIPADVIIVDEASMIDLALMANLIQATSVNTRLILVGDKDQLASVEAGSVMGDICTGLSTPAAKDCHQNAKNSDGVELKSQVVVLRTNYRFGSNSGINDLGRAINDGRGQSALDLLMDSRKADIAFKPIYRQQDVEQAMTKVVKEAIAPIFDISDPRAALEQFNQIKILSPVRQGPFGVESLNLLVERKLARLGLVHPLIGRSADWYPGRPVLINRNDYHHNLFNGDVGITIVEGAGEQQRVRVGFSDSDGRIRFLAPEQLPNHETVFAMSVHKSQGTEFTKVLLILPDHDTPLLTRELIYTAVTRARRHVEIWGHPEILSAAIGRRVQRASGLKQKLRQVQ